MSQSTATARLATRSTWSPRAPERPRLRVVDAAPVRASHLGYGVLCAALVVAGLLLMLVLNTARAEGSFELSRLQERTGQLQADQLALEAQLAELRSPQSLAAAADALGMVPSPSTAVLRLSDGAVLGVAAGVGEDGPFTVDLSAPKARGRGEGGSLDGTAEDQRAED